MKNLKGAVAVVTGAGSGIGRATSLELARRGCELALVDISENGALETAAMVQRMGRGASVHTADVSDKAQMQALPEAVRAKHPKINIVVNNAGVCVVSAFQDHRIEDFEWILGINLWGVIYGSKFFLPHLQKAGEGHIVNISSLVGFFPLPGFSSYAVTKYAVRGFSEVLRAELAGQNIGVTSVHPGIIDTNISSAARYVGVSQGIRTQGSTALAKLGKSPEYAAKKIVEGIERNAGRVLVGPDAHVFDLIARASPMVTRLLARAATGGRSLVPEAKQ